jgi:hypothetical protein
MQAGNRFSFCYLLHSGLCVAHSAALKMGMIYFSETSVEFYLTIWQYIPEDRTLHSQHCENLKSNICIYCFHSIFLNIFSINRFSSIFLKSGNWGF